MMQAAALHPLTRQSSGSSRAASSTPTSKPASSGDTSQPAASSETVRSSFLRDLELQVQRRTQTATPLAYTFGGRTNSADLLRSTRNDDVLPSNVSWQHAALHVHGPEQVRTWVETSAVTGAGVDSAGADVPVDGAAEAVEERGPPWPRAGRRPPPPLHLPLRHRAARH